MTHTEYGAVWTAIHLTEEKRLEFIANKELEKVRAVTISVHDSIRGNGNEQEIILLKLCFGGATKTHIFFQVYYENTLKRE